MSISCGWKTYIVCLVESRVSIFCAWRTYIVCLVETCVSIVCALENLHSLFGDLCEHLLSLDVLARPQKTGSKYNGQTVDTHLVTGLMNGNSETHGQ